MQIAVRKFFIEFHAPFTIASGTRTGTHAVYARVSLDGITGYGEASMPPYVTETQETVTEFLQSIKLEKIKHTDDVLLLLAELHNDDSENQTAKACLDIALHDWLGKAARKPLHCMWELDATQCPANTYTIGISSAADLPRKVQQCVDFDLIKVKLGGTHDKETITALRALTDKAICVDANQGWHNKEEAIAMIDWLSDKHITFIEQPLPKEHIDDMAWVHTRSSIPVIADESFQTAKDLEQLAGACAGINIKLMKCGGLHTARAIATQAKALDMKILLGCMSESSCGVSAAAQLAPLATWTDLDGPLLIKNDPFTGITYKHGKIVLSEIAGCGVELRDNTFFDSH